ncbi:MAG: HPr family phosphocarrier protein [Planctomycetota bacterium]
MEFVQTLKVTHKYGLHARASNKFAELAQAFSSDVFLSRPGGEEVDGKSVLGILTLGMEEGEELILRVHGEDAEMAMPALVDLVKSDFHGV